MNCAWLLCTSISEGHIAMVLKSINSMRETDLREYEQNDEGHVDMVVTAVRGPVQCLQGGW